MDENKNVIVEAQDEKPAEKKYKRYDVFAFIVCLLVAVSIWIYVMNTTQTEIERTVTLTVDVSDQIYQANGMTIFSNLDDTFEGSELDYSKLRVDLTVTGMKNVLDKYTAEDYKISVDTSEIQSAAVQRISFLYDMPSAEITFKSITTALPVDALYIDKPATTTLTKVSASLKSPAASGTSVRLTPQLTALNISGPEKTVNSITRAEIIVDTSRMMTSGTVTAEDIKIFGADGEIKSTYIDIEPAAVNVDVMIEAERRFPIAFKQTAAVDNEYKYTLALTGDVTDILLYGDTALMSFDNFVIDIGDITKLSELTGSVAVKDLQIPEGLSLGTGMADLSVSYVITKEAVVSDNKTVGENS